LTARLEWLSPASLASSDRLREDALTAEDGVRNMRSEAVAVRPSFSGLEAVRRLPPPRLTGSVFDRELRPEKSVCQNNARLSALTMSSR
jgi:hypothetical protein